MVQKNLTLVSIQGAIFPARLSSPGLGMRGKKFTFF